MNIFGRNSQVQINGKTYVGNNISISNGQVYINGKLEDEHEEKMVVTIIGSGVERIESDEAITIKGNVTGDVTSKVNVNCDNVIGDVKAGVNVNCDDIKGNAEAGITINCDDIHGNARASKINR